MTPQDQSTELHQWLDAVSAIMASVNLGDGPRAILDLVAEKACLLLDLDFCGVLVPDATGSKLVIAGWSGLSKEYVDRINSDHPVRIESHATLGAPSSRAFVSGQPVAVPNIAVETGFAWVGVAHEQGYQSMLSVPLVTELENLGTLNSYRSDIHEFTELEIERLQLLAHHAAVVLKSARVLEDLRRQHELVTRSERIHERLIDISLREGGVEGIARVVSELLAAPTLVEDARGDELAQVGPRAELPSRAQRDAVPIGRGRIWPDVDLVSGHASFCVVIVVLDGSITARLWLARDLASLAPLDFRALEHGSIMLSLELLRRRTAAEVEQRLRGELLADVLTGTALPSESVIGRARLLGYDLARPHLVLILRISTVAGASIEQVNQRALREVARLASSYDPRPLVAIFRDRLVALWPVGATRKDRPANATDELHAIGDAVRRAAASATGVAEAMVVVSSPVLGSPANTHRTALGALSFVASTGARGRTVTLGDLGIAGLLLQLDDPAQLLGFVDRVLGPVRRHDQDHGTDLMRTARAYLNSGLDRRVTATRLAMHPNTVSQRLRRIETVAGVDLADPATVVDVRAALVLLDIAQVS